MPYEFNVVVNDHNSQRAHETRVQALIQCPFKIKLKIKLRTSKHSIALSRTIFKPSKIYTYNVKNKFNTFKTSEFTFSSLILSTL